MSNSYMTVTGPITYLMLFFAVIGLVASVRWLYAHLARKK